HRPQLPRGVRHQRQRAHRDRPHAVRHHPHRQRPRPHRRQPPQGVLGSQLMTAATGAKPLVNAYASGRISPHVPWLLLAATMTVSVVSFVFIWLAEPGGEYNIAAAVFLGVAGYALAIYVVSRLVEGPRPAMNRLVTTLVVLTFVIALLPLISLMFTVIVNGLPRFDLTFFTWSMRNVVGEGGGALHAIVGTLLMTGTAALISIPIGLLT